MQPLEKPPEPGQPPVPLVAPESGHPVGTAAPVLSPEQPGCTAVPVFAPEPGQAAGTSIPVLAPEPGQTEGAAVPVLADNDNPDDDDMCPDWTELTSTIGSFFNRDCILTLIAKHLKREIENQ